jgi:hypothetical protein
MLILQYVLCFSLFCGESLTLHVKSSCFTLDVHIAFICWKILHSINNLHKLQDLKVKNICVNND